MAVNALENYNILCITSSFDSFFFIEESMSVSFFLFPRPLEWSNVT